MDEARNIKSSWKNFPENIIRFASRFENTDNDFERLIGFLLLDVGVENLLKTFVLDSNLSYKNKNESIKGMVKKDTLPNSITTLGFEKIRFHQLTEAARDAAESKVTDNDFKSAENFHEIRNLIYHEARKTFPSKQDFHEYLTLAKSFLQILLDIEWETSNSNLDQKENQLPKDVNSIDAMEYFFFNPEQEFNNLRRDISVATALHRPKYTTRSFEEKLKELWKDYADTFTLNSELPPSVYDFAKSELLKSFNEITGIKITDPYTILEVCDDVHLLQLGVLLTEFGDDVMNEMDNFVKFREYRRKQNIKELTNSDIKISKDFNIWVTKIQEKMNSFIEEKISKS